MVVLPGSPHARLDGDYSSTSDGHVVGEATLALVCEQRAANLIAVVTAVDANGINFFGSEVAQEAKSQLIELLGLEWSSDLADDSEYL